MSPANQVREMFLKGAFFFIVGVVLATLFIWSMVQGVLSHMATGQFTLLYYFVAWLAGIGGLTLYHEARSILHYARISK